MFRCGPILVGRGPQPLLPQPGRMVPPRIPAGRGQPHIDLFRLGRDISQPAIRSHGLDPDVVDLNHLDKTHAGRLGLHTQHGHPALTEFWVVFEGRFQIDVLGFG